MSNTDILNELVVIMETCDTDTFLKLDKLGKEIMNNEIIKYSEIDD